MRIEFSKPIKIIALVLVLMVFVSSFVYSVSVNQADGKGGYSLNRGEAKEVTIYNGACYKVTNSPASVNYFIPTAKREEWAAFVTRAPALGISVGSCLPPTAPCLGDETSCGAPGSCVNCAALERRYFCKDGQRWYRTQVCDTYTNTCKFPEDIVSLTNPAGEGLTITYISADGVPITCTPDPATVTCNLLVIQRCTDGGIVQTYGTKDCPTVPTACTPDPATVCLGESFIQTCEGSTPGMVRTNVGSKRCPGSCVGGVCLEDSTVVNCGPDPTQICRGVSFSQICSDGSFREQVGTQDCTSPTPPCDCIPGEQCIGGSCFPASQLEGVPSDISCIIDCDLARRVTCSRDGVWGAWSCGTPCGQGTRTCTSSETTCPSTTLCAAKQADTCIGQDVGRVSCPGTTETVGCYRTGTKDCGSTPTPTPTTPTCTETCTSASSLPCGAYLADSWICGQTVYCPAVTGTGKNCGVKTCGTDSCGNSCGSGDCFTEG